MLKWKYPASITYLCHKYLITTFRWYYTYLTMTNMSDIGSLVTLKACIYNTILMSLQCVIMYLYINVCIISYKQRVRFNPNHIHNHCVHNVLQCIIETDFIEGVSGISLLSGTDVGRDSIHPILVRYCKWVFLLYIVVPLHKFF